MSVWDFTPHIEIKHKPIIAKYVNPFSDIILNPDIASFSEEEQFHLIKNCIEIYNERWNNSFRFNYITGYVYRRNIGESIDLGLDGEPLNLINKFKEKDFEL